MKLIVGVIAALMIFSSAANQNANPSGSLNSAELVKIKKNYEKCVFEKGKLILKKSNLRDAMDFAPLACKKDLLQAKKYFLDRSISIEVLDQLVDSIEEGIKIDLANELIATL
ncbi:hypothetical protein [uncultured Paraglaciecola sp.]|uniref:hypothetical protein n=1 Tax=uncultured Paraglaciecola sp. TaxID=1765024 RepID=UPI0030D758F5|tara:strand:+ start:88137 stop:88475 length:339 start_codon:yes stop_codon:yes gene_type:complete